MNRIEQSLQSMQSMQELGMLASPRRKFCAKEPQLLKLKFEPLTWQRNEELWQRQLRAAASIRFDQGVFIGIAGLFVGFIIGILTLAFMVLK